MKSHWFYYFTKYATWLGLRLFFKRLRIHGLKNIPKDGALIYTPNHQGAFMDAMLVGANVPRPMSFLTRADVFTKLSTPLLRALNMMPIYRIRDGISSLSQNDAVFETCFQMLSEERSILIFPEGNHGIEYFLRPISKGTSRLALDARDRISKDTKIYIIPTGINYFSHYKPWAKCHLKFGEPIALEKYMELYAEHKQKAYNQLKADLEVAMKKVLIIAEEKEDYIQRRDWIFQPKHESLPFEKLQEMAISGTPEPVKPRTKNILVRGLIGLLTVFNLLPILGLKKILSGIKDKVFYVSIKYFAGSLLHILWWSLIYAIGVIWIGWQAGLLFAFALIMLAFARQSLIKY